MIEYVLTAVALVMVMEGILPFLSPQRLRRFFIQIASQNDKSIRLVGLILMILGTLLMYVVHSGFFD